MHFEVIHDYTELTPEVPLPDEVPPRQERRRGVSRHQGGKGEEEPRDLS
jgi:hypothetical protein